MSSHHPPSIRPPPPPGPPPAVPAILPAAAAAGGGAVRGWFSPKKRSKISSSDSSSGRSTPPEQEQEEDRDRGGGVGGGGGEGDDVEDSSSSLVSSTDTLNDLSDSPCIPILAAASLRGSKGHKDTGERAQSPSNISSDGSSHSHMDSTHDSSSLEPLRKMRKKCQSSAYKGVTVVEVKVKILADLMEALIGAFYWQGGLQGAVAAMQALGVWPGPVRQVEGGEVRINGSNNVFGAEEDNTPCPDDLTATVYPVSLPPPHSISPVPKRDIIPEYPPLYPVRPVRAPAMSAVCAIMEKRLGYLFQDSGLLLMAVTHCSVPGVPSNQRLEFLGDAVLDFVVVKELHRYVRSSLCTCILVLVHQRISLSYRS